MITKSAMACLFVALAVATHLGVAFAGRSVGYLEGYGNGVRDGHLAVRRAVNGQVEAFCPEDMFNPKPGFDGRYCVGAMEVQMNLEQRVFPNAGKVYRDPYQGIENYLVTPH